MDISSIRKQTGLSQSQFARFFGIPVGTLRNWEQGIAKPPEYVYGMIQVQARRDRMINIETLKLIDKMNRLAKETEMGYKNFEDIPEGESFAGVIYDGAHPDENGAFPVALDILNHSEHHDIISTYDDLNGEYTIRLYLPEEDDEEPYIWVRFPFDDYNSFTIEDGHWSMDMY